MQGGEGKLAAEQCCVKRDQRFPLVCGRVQNEADLADGVVDSFTGDPEGPVVGVLDAVGIQTG